MVDGRRAPRARRRRADRPPALRLVRAVPQARGVAAREGRARKRRADGRGPRRARPGHALRAHVLGRPGPRRSVAPRAQARPARAARHLDRPRRGGERPGDRARPRGASPRRRCHRRGGRRQRGAAAPRAAGRRTPNVHRTCPGGDVDPRDLRRRLGVLAAQPRARRRSVVRHRPHAALLGGRPAAGRARGGSRRARPRARARGVPGKGHPRR